MLRLGKLYRYYPTPLFSVRKREPVYPEIVRTIINFPADSRTYSYTIPTVREMVIHLEVKRIRVLIPRNRYDQVLKAVNNSSDHILALAGNFSKNADGHFVCVQHTRTNTLEKLDWYSTDVIYNQEQLTRGKFFLVLKLT